jgi:crossover junction endodeoxyribonuclease RuvC
MAGAAGAAKMQIETSLDPERVVMGVDPGVTGGLAFVSASRIEAFDIPVVAGEVDVDELVRVIQRFTPTLAVVEKAGAMPKQWVASTFKYGVAYGALRAALVACNVPTHLVAASKWKRFYGLDSDKEKARAMAVRMWPRMRPVRAQEGPRPRRGGAPRPVRHGARAMSPAGSPCGKEERR